MLEARPVSCLLDEALSAAHRAVVGMSHVGPTAGVPAPPGCCVGRELFAQPRVPRSLAALPRLSPEAERPASAFGLYSSAFALSRFVAVRRVSCFPPSRLFLAPVCYRATRRDEDAVGHLDARAIVCRILALTAPRVLRARKFIRLSEPGSPLRGKHLGWLLMRTSVCHRGVLASPRRKTVARAVRLRRWEPLPARSGPRALN